MNPPEEPSSIAPLETATEPIIATAKLTKFYGKVRGVENLDLQVRRGEIFGFLGPNGAGKTTTIRLLLDFIRPTSGHASIFGHDCQQDSLLIRRRLGYLPGDVALYDSLSGREYLSFMSSLHGHGIASRATEMADTLELDLGRKIKGYSRGMRQKLGIILALLHEHDLLILDEPTLGLDPLMQHKVYEILLQEKAKGCTIFFSSHNLTEVEHVCDRAGILRSGSLVAIEDVHGLRRVRLRHYQVTFAPDAFPSQAILPGAEIIERRGNIATFLVHGNVDAFLKALSQYQVEDLVTHETSLEDIFMRFYGQEGPS